MSGITALGTTYNLPNYTGVLFGLTPAETPFLSAIGGLTGGGQATSTEFEWQTFDLANAGQNVALEGADAPSYEGRVRANVTNVPRSTSAPSESPTPSWPRSARSPAATTTCRTRWPTS
jgi:hypothetical protein